MKRDQTPTSVIIL